ncbi:MAG: hypothetical protein ACF8LK_09250 [Phycisphaerales bacterium JB041]
MRTDEVMGTLGTALHNCLTINDAPGGPLTTLAPVAEAQSPLTTGFLLLVALMIIAGLLWRAGTQGSSRSTSTDRSAPGGNPAAGRRDRVDAAVLAGRLFGGRLLLIGCAALSFVVLCAWLTGWKSAQSLVPGLPTMKFNTALGLLCIAAAGILATLLPTRSSPRRSAAAGAAATVLAASAMMISCATLTQAGLGVDLGIDTLVSADPASVQAGLAPGRMSQATAVGILLLSLGTLGGLARAERLARRTLTAGGVVGGVAIMLFFLRAWNLPATAAYSGIAIHTSLVLFAGAIGLHFAFTARRQICDDDLLSEVQAERSSALQTLGFVAAAMLLGLSATAVIVSESHKALHNNAAS